MKMMEERRVDFLKVKGHEGDEWNTRVDKLAVIGRNKKAKEVCVKIAMKIKVGQDHRFFAVERFHLKSLDDLRDIWPSLQEAAPMSLGSWEDYAIWQKFGNKPRVAEMPWREGQIYEIVPTTSAPEADAAKDSRMASISEGSCRPVKIGRRGSVERVPPRMPEVAGGVDRRVTVKFVYEDGTNKEWSDTLRKDDTEARSLQRAMSTLGEYGSWRVVKSIANEQGKQMEVSKKKKSVTMRYTVGTNPEITEPEIGMEGTVRSILGKLKVEEHVIVDQKGTRFLEQDHLFTYFSQENPAPLRILKAPKTLYPKTRTAEAVRDAREGITVTFGDKSWRGQKSDGANYRLIFERAQAEMKIEGWWKVG
jgi:hypothetical protein